MDTNATPGDAAHPRPSNISSTNNNTTTTSVSGHSNFLSFGTGSVGDRRRMEIPWRHITKQLLDNICRAILDRETEDPIRIVDFMDNQLGPSAAQKIASCLESAPVSEVLMRFNDIGKEGCDALAGVVSISRSLQVLDIRGNGLSSSDVRKLLKAIAMSTMLLRVGLGSNKLGPEGATLVYKALEKNTYLTSLDLSANEIGPSGAEAIADLLMNQASTLKVLQLDSNYLGVPGVTAICQAMKSNKELRRLTLGSNHATDEAAGAMAGMLEMNYVLESLDLRLNSLTATAVKELVKGLSKNTSLRFLSLAGNPIGPVGADEITRKLSAHQRSALENLDLSSCSLTPTGGMRIASLLGTSMSLKDVNLSDNALDDEAAVSLAQNITTGIAISIVDLSCNTIGEDGAAQLIDAALMNAQLSALVLHGNRINRVVQKKIDNLLEERLARNRVLHQNTALYQQQMMNRQSAKQAAVS